MISLTIPFDPEIHLGPIALAWHGIFTAVGIFFGVWLAVRLLRGRVPEDAAYSVATWAVVCGIVGARVLHVMDCWVPGPSCGEGYAADPIRVVEIWTGGIAVLGALIGGVIGGFIAALRRGDIDIGAAADRAAAGIGLGFGIGRIGDVINGEHHAKLCGSGPGVCVEFTDPNTLGQGPSFAPDDPLRRYAPGPVQLVVLYDMIWDLLGVGLVLLLLHRFGDRLGSGRIFWIWTIWYGLGRFADGFLRIDNPTPFAGLRQDQIVGLLLAVVSLVALALLQAGILPQVLRRLRPKAAQPA